VGTGRGQVRDGTGPVPTSGKNIVLCCDGTGNAYSGTPSNVLRTYSWIERSPQQVACYHPGVGTHPLPEGRTRIGRRIRHAKELCVGAGVIPTVVSLYTYLLQHYEPDDNIFLFGFSRGAFTARSIAGMIRKCGILKRTCVDQYVPAIAAYRDANLHPDDPNAVKFRAANSCGGDTIPIRFIGVWDTVGSLGIPLRGLRWLTRRKVQFHDTELSKVVQTACHALAIDEHRHPFLPTLWLEKPKPNQTVEQVWFPGCHSDVGGGYAETDLSDVTLQWMLGKASAAGLQLDAEVIAARPLAPKPTGTMHNSKTGLYRLTPGDDRVIGAGGTQSVHPSALARWDADRSYRPKNLRAYFSATGDSRAKA